ncbi:diguanylate cyclase [Salimicrobium sp. PL1-032A]|uniref:diguanylate cyclase n=1 Tax=Salimicrobium sp. PL1-032A TaxID=3095364 RepID=UPI00325FF27D
MEKTQQLMWERIDRKIELWHTKKHVKETELLQFLEQNRHMLTHFHFEEATRLTEKFLLFLSKSSEKYWTVSEWLPLLRNLQETFTLTPSKENIRTLSLPEDKQPLLLIIDDDMDFITYMKDYLEDNGYQVMAALSGRKGLELFYDVNPDLVLLDYVLPDIDGISLLTQITEKAKNEFTPVMMVSAHVSNEHKKLSYNLGVWDFIGKPINTEIFLPFLNNRLSYSRKILKHTMEDELTGSYNRRFLERELTNQLELCQESTYCFSIAMVDLDHFKTINDTYGHHMGDQVLETLVHVFEYIKDADDTICRYGGEEFTVLFPSTDKEGAIAKIEAWRNAFSSNTFLSGNEEFQVYFSAGVTKATTGSHKKELLEQADKALYHAKRSGRNRTSVYSATLADIDSEENVCLLVVDEDSSLRNDVYDSFSANTFLGEKTLKIKTFESGDELLQSDWHTPDMNYILLLDLSVSSNDKELIEEIRHSYPTDNIEITVMVEEQETGRMEEILKAGADDYITKPFDVEEIRARLDVLVDRMFD